ncbi:EpsG family protein [Fusobacterium nucleatum]|uniref:EpsG family protein n=1 Tax=Fusobacterium nucleatum TaxID=851 RepID=UPI003D052F3E
MNLYYGILIVLYFFISIFTFSRKTGKVLYVFSGMLLVLYAGLRSFNSTEDARAYYDYYNNIPSITSFFEYKNNIFEKGYMFLNMLLKTFNFDYRFLFLIVAFISVTINFITIKKYTKNIYLCIFIYITNIYVINELILIRTGIATSILFYSIGYMKKNPKKYLYFIFLAYLFHRLALIALIPLFLLKFKMLDSKKKIFFFLILSFILGEIDIFKRIFFAMKYIFPSKLTYYYEYYEYTEGSYRKVIFLLPILFYFLNNYKKYENIKFFQESFIYLNCSIFSLLLFIKNNTLLRVPFIYSIGLIILGDIFISQKTKNEKLFWKFLISSVSLFLLMWTLRGNELITFVT